MPDLVDADAQLAALKELDELLGGAAVEYWLFGGWAVDAHTGRVTREHDDLDVAVWLSDARRVVELLDSHGWARQPEAGEDGYTCFARHSVRLDLVFLVRDDAGRVYTPVREGRADWPDGAFGDAVAAVRGIRVRVIGRDALIAEKSATRDDPVTAAKDRQDAAVLNDRT